MRHLHTKHARWNVPFILILSLHWGAFAQFYSVTDLGTLAGSNCVAYGINNQEQIVGAAQTHMGTHHAYMFQGGRMMDLGTMGGSNSWAFGINDAGWTVGGADSWMTNTHAFLCTNALTGSPMMDLGTLGGSNSMAWMVNMHGDIVGWASMTNGSQHAFFITNGIPFHMTDLGTAGGTNSAAYCINSNRMVVGKTMMPDGSVEPIMATNAMFGSSSMMLMGMGGIGASGGQSWFINNMGLTAGDADMPGGNHHAIVSGSGGMMGRMNVDLGTLGGSNSMAYCINDAGTVVGTAQMTNGIMHAFMLTNGFGGMVRMMDLNALVPTNCGWELMEARGINNAGQIVGWGMHGGHTNAFLLTPVAGPTMMMSGPMPGVVGPGTQMTLNMHMSTTEPLTYQWMHNGVIMPGATNATLNVGNMTAGMAGMYTVVVRNHIGTVATASTGISMFDVALTNGSPRLMLAAPDNTQFRIDCSEALGPSANWQSMTNFTVMDSMTLIMDTAMPGSHGRFYRAVMLP